MNATRNTNRQPGPAEPQQVPEPWTPEQLADARRKFDAGADEARRKWEQAITKTKKKNAKKRATREKPTAADYDTAGYWWQDL